MVKRIPSDMIEDRETGQKLSEIMKEVTSDLADKATKEELQQVSISFKESYSTLAAPVKHIS